MVSVVIDGPEESERGESSLEFVLGGIIVSKGIEKEKNVTKDMNMREQLSSM